MGKFKPNRKNIRELRKDPEIAAFLLSEAERIADTAGPGYEASGMIGKNRARASVITTTFDAMRREAKYGTLSKAAGLG